VRTARDLRLEPREDDHPAPRVPRVPEIFGVRADHVRGEGPDAVADGDEAQRMERALQQARREQVAIDREVARTERAFLTLALERVADG
jgi:hypothetical protein